MDENETSSAVAVPRWVLILIASMLFNVLVTVFGAGVVWSKVGTLADGQAATNSRMDRIEGELFSLLGLKK